MGRLVPAMDAALFELWEHPIDGPGLARLEVLRDGLVVWSRAGARRIRSRGQAERFIRVLLGAYAFYTGVVLDFAATGWVEATKAEFEGTWVGFVLGGGKARPPTRKAGRHTTDLRRAAVLAGAVELTAWRRTLTDLRDAHRAAAAVRGENPNDDAGDDAFVYAHRAIESARSAAATDAGAVDLRDWAYLHALLNTNEGQLKARIKRLEDARDAVVHASDPRAILRAARRDVTQLTDIARNVVADALEAKNLVDRSHLRYGSSHRR
jgi:hypothetical protein